MKVTYQKSLRYKLLQRMQSLPGNVVLRADIADLADKRQVSYAIKQLIKDKRIVRLGYGIYAKAYPSQYVDVPLLQGAGFAEVIRETLNRLNIPWEASEAEQDYNLRRSTQVPVQSSLKLKARFRRSLKYGNITFPLK